MCGELYTLDWQFFPVGGTIYGTVLNGNI